MNVIKSIGSTWTHFYTQIIFPPSHTPLSWILTSFVPLACKWWQIIHEPLNWAETKRQTRLSLARAFIFVLSLLMHVSGRLKRCSRWIKTLILVGGSYVCECKKREPYGAGGKECDSVKTARSCFCDNSEQLCDCGRKLSGAWPCW